MRLSLQGLVILCIAALCFFMPAEAQDPAAEKLQAKIDTVAKSIESKVIAWRRDIHQNPELGNREFRTAKKVADHLKRLGLEVRTEVAHTGVVGVLYGKKDGPVVALRADMDALPITEMVDVPFASKIKATYAGSEVGVMHACGHDMHTAILMGTAEVLSNMRDQLPGTVKFLFQPAEEGAPQGEEGGANLMIKEGALENPQPDAILGLHVAPMPLGMVATRPGAILASSDGLYIKVKGKQTHAASPWSGVDPIVVSSQIVMGLQTIVSRQINLTASPAIISFGSIHGGVRGNIIPGEVELVGTIRVMNSSIRTQIHKKIRKTAVSIAEAAGAEAVVQILYGYPVTINNTGLYEEMVPVLKSILGERNVISTPPATASEDFSYYARKIPGLFLFLGTNTPGANPGTVAPPHSPLFCPDEGALFMGMRSLAGMVFAYLQNH